MTQRPVTTREAADQTGVPANLIAVWKNRKLITPIGITRDKAPVYDLEEIRPLADRYWARRIRRGQPPITSER